MNKIEIGTTKKIGNYDFIILDTLGNGVLCLAKDFVYKNTQFDKSSNDYANSSIRKKINTDFLAEVEKEIGAKNIIQFELDLTSDDGLDDYGKVSDKVGLLTADMYRKYNRIIEQYPVSDWWWLSTAWSTPHRGWEFAVRVVDSCGALLSLSCDYRRGVRPFLIFNTSIF